MSQMYYATDRGTTPNNDASTSEKAAQTEFIAVTEIHLRKGNYWLCPICKRHIHESFLGANNVHETVCNRKTLNQLIQNLPEEEFHRPPKATRSDRLSIKRTHDAAIHLVQKKSTDDPKQMKVMFEAVVLLRKEINGWTKSVFSVICQCEFSVSSDVFVCTRW